MFLILSRPNNAPPFTVRATAIIALAPYHSTPERFDYTEVYVTGQAKPITASAAPADILAALGYGKESEHMKVFGGDPIIGLPDHAEIVESALLRELQDAARLVADDLEQFAGDAAAQRVDSGIALVALEHAKRLHAALDAL